MALITKFTPRPGGRVGYRTTVECGFTVGVVGTARLLHLETYGSSSRAIPGKVSQSLELDEDRARELVAILRDAFPGL